jgi:hypothetical protein
MSRDACEKTAVRDANSSQIADIKITRESGVAVMITGKEPIFSHKNYAEHRCQTPI